jgi:medium-chain acyl-[acyl-carrier-protein] hydrolase
LRLVCLPHAGGSVADFAPWAAHLPTEVEVLPVQLPGRHQRAKEPPFERMAPLVEALGEAMPTEDISPLAVFGHSMGGLLGFELARWLRRQGRPQPAILIVAACPAPQLPPRLPPLHDLPDGELLAAVRGRFAGIPSQVAEHEELIRLVLPVLRADLALVETYCHVDEPPLNCPVLVMGGADDPCVPAAELAAWRAQTCGQFSLRLFPGGHFFWHEEPAAFLRLIAGRLRPLLVPQHVGDGGRIP